MGAPAATATTVIDADDETGLDTTRVVALSERDANEADVIDQATVVPVPEDDDWNAPNSASAGPLQ
jgi:hypothetical protein